MDYAYRLFRNVQFFYNSINPATLSGAIDLIVVEQPDGSYQSTPFHVRFGKYGVLNSNEKYVDIMINGEEIELKMKLGENGVAFFVEETESDDVPEHLVTSPLPGQKIDTDKVLAESAAVLQRQHRREKKTRGRHSAPGTDSSTSRSPSPRNRCQTMDDKQRTAQLAMKHKKSLPFSSSVFSARRYRSLPDLSSSFVCHNGNESPQKTAGGRTPCATPSMVPTVPMDPSTSETTTSKTAVVNPDDSTPITNAPFNPKKLRHSKSAIYDSRGRQQRSTSIDDDGSRVSPGKRKTATSECEQQPPPVDEPLPIRPETRSSSQESDGEDTTSSSSSSESERRNLTEHDLIQDSGALSDSEVDRHRHHSETDASHHDGPTEWKWGEYPESATKKKSSETKGKTEEKDTAKKTYWDWFRWSRTKPAEDGGIYLDDLVEKGQKDPEQMKVYIGGRSTEIQCKSSAAIDSGNGSLSSGPSSPPMIASDAEEASSSSIVEEKQKKKKAPPPPTPEFVEKAVEKQEVIERVELGESVDEAVKEVKQGQQLPTPEASASPRSARALSPAVSDAGSIESVDGKTYFRSLRLSSDRLKALRLHRGSNEARFSVTTKFQGTSWCSCHIYLYKWNEKIIISDIDGTITKSDLLGHVIPAIGGTWAHAGVAELYTRIKNNGYQLVYLSSRAIGQSYYTKKYLQSVAQDSMVLPDGPVLLSPTSVLLAFRREVIDRRPEEFKIAALTDLKALFPVKKPFYAGIGNRETDVISYRAVNIPPERILMVEPSGRVRRADSIGFISSYQSMAIDTVDYLFPPLIKHRPNGYMHHSKSSSIHKLETEFTKPQHFSTFTHWRPNAGTTTLKIGDNEKQDDELVEYEKRRKEEEKKRKKQEEEYKKAKKKAKK